MQMWSLCSAKGHLKFVLAEADLVILAKHEKKQFPLVGWTLGTSTSQTWAAQC